MLPNLGVPELILILVVALIIFGPGKLPQVGKSLGRTIREFRSATRESLGDVTDTVQEVKADIREVKQTLEAAPTEEDTGAAAKS